MRAIISPTTQPDSIAAGQREIITTEADGPRDGTKQNLRFGVYDPEEVFAGDADLKLRHVYCSWSNFDAEALVDQLTRLEQGGFEILLTIEPWQMANSDQPLLTAINDGKYDGIIDSLAGLLRRLEGPIFVAWGHEMDQDLTERYPWSGQEPEQYVAAYRHVVDRIRDQVGSATRLRWIWAAVLKEGSMRYWPGDDYVDFIGMPIYSFPQWDRQNHGFIRDFRTTFEEKRKVVQGVDKPLMITELGVSGSEDFESFWLHQAFQSLEQYPELGAVIFFYGRETEGAWGSGVETPDWRVHPDAIRGLVRWKLSTAVH